MRLTNPALSTVLPASFYFIQQPADKFKTKFWLLAYTYTPGLVSSITLGTRFVS